MGSSHSLDAPTTAGASPVALNPLGLKNCKLSTRRIERMQAARLSNSDSRHLKDATWTVYDDAAWRARADCDPSSGPSSPQRIPSIKTRCDVSMFSPSSVSDAAVIEHRKPRRDEECPSPTSAMHNEYDDDDDDTVFAFED